MSKILEVNRAIPLSTRLYPGRGWSIWRGSLMGNGLEGDEQQDVRSLAITKLELGKLRLVPVLKSGEGSMSISFREYFLRPQEPNQMLLDAQVGQTLMRHKNLIPNFCKERIGGNVSWIHLGGTILRREAKTIRSWPDIAMLWFCWATRPGGDKEWSWGYSFSFDVVGSSDMLLVL